MSLTRLVRLGSGAVVAVALALFLAPNAAAAAPPVKIVKVQYDSPGADRGGNTSINAEYVIIKNVSTRTQTLTGWTLRDKQNHVYKFPRFTLGAGKSVVVRSGKGTVTAATRYFNSASYIWNNTGDTAYLRTASGAALSSCGWTSLGRGYKSC